MPVSVLMPRERAPEKDPLDTILKGLNIASGVYGLKDAYDKSKLLEQEKKASQFKEDEGILSKKEFLDAGKSYDIVAPKTPNSLKFKVSTGAGDSGEMGYEDVWLSPRKKGEMDPIDRELKSLRMDLMKKDLTKSAQTDMPLENKLVVSGLSQKNAAKISIANQIDSVMGNWDNLSDDQKVVQGGQLLKTLNSPEGADAIGAEEAKRLGGLLQFKVFNVLEPGSFIGRDLPQFKEQAMGTSKGLKEAISRNQQIIGSLTGRKQTPLVDQQAQNKPSMPTVESPFLPSANAGKIPDFNSMTDEQLKKYLGK